MDVSPGLDGEHQRSKAEIFWMLNFNEWHFLLIKIHKEAANVNGFCDGCWIFTFLEKWCIGKQSSIKITQSKL